MEKQNYCHFFYLRFAGNIYALIGLNIKIIILKLSSTFIFSKNTPKKSVSPKYLYFIKHFCRYLLNIHIFIYFVESFLFILERNSNHLLPESLVF